jgi:predicted enzyme related to lactoylglutathione lyase
MAAPAGNISTTILFPVTDVARAKAIYSTLLGIAPTTDGPYYVGFTVGDQETGLVPNGHTRGMTGPVAYWNVADIQRSLAALRDAGAQMQEDVKDVGGGKLIATVRDADGNTIGLLQPA